MKNRIKQILNSENLDAQRELISSIASELEIDSLTCAAALIFLTQTAENIPVIDTSLSRVKQTDQLLPTKNTPLTIKMVRYRLDVGSKHRITLGQLKKVLVEESGVDINNINNVNIQGLYTLIELPDEMPPEIFQHLKSVEINQHKLDIKRVKARNKKRFIHHMRRGQNRGLKPGNETVDQVDGGSNKTAD